MGPSLSRAIVLGNLSRPLSPRLLATLARRIGVTRVARVTGLDRSGVEVACAIRPAGHVLQISNGKGFTWATARAGAVLEAAELWASEQRPPFGDLVFASAAELRCARSPFLLCEALLAAGPLARPARRTLRLAFRPARDLFTGRGLLVPLGAAHCLPPGSAWTGPLVHRWTSNGMGAHPDSTAALLHALLEALERDGLAHALPNGFTPGTLRTRLLDIASPLFARACPRTARLASALVRHDLRPCLFDLRPSCLDLPLCGALLVDDPHAPIPLTAGYACGLRRDDALLSALLEAAQSRLTDIHGARDDIVHTPEAREDLRGLAQACRATTGRRSPLLVPEVGTRDTGQAVARVLSALARRGITQGAVVKLCGPKQVGSALPVHVVKVLLPDLRVSELL